MIGFKRLVLCIALCGLGAAFASAQETDLSAISAGKLKKLGKNAQRMGDTYSAIDYYEAYLNKKESDAAVMYSLAELYRASRNYKKAMPMYKKAFDAEPEKNVLAEFYYANMLKVYKEYDPAYEVYRKFRKDVRENEKLKDYRKIAQKQMQACLDAQRIMDSAVVVWMIHLDSTINKASVEFAPMFLNDSTFVYASLKSDTAVYTIIDEDAYEKPKGPARQFYIGERKTSSWTNKGEWRDGDFNIEGVNTGNGALSVDKKRFYFTRCEEAYKGKTLCKIYQSKKVDGKWQPAEALPEEINMPKTTSTQPTLSSDSKTSREVLYFVSDREGGKGGLDIWYTMYDKRKKVWKTPKNCGSKINTPGDEVTPFMDLGTRNLYFSSNGHPTLGELDIFRALGENSKWMPAENVGYPINSQYDDFYYVLNANKEDGFIVSNRPGGFNITNPTCCDDIYAFKYNEVVKIGTTGKTYAIVDEDIRDLFEDKFETSIDIGGNVVDTSGLEYAEGVVVSLFLIDKQNMDLVFITNDTTDANGDYFFQLEPNKEYALEFENYGHFNKKLKISTDGMMESDTIRNEAIGINVIPKEPLVIKNVYYDFNSAQLGSKAKKNLSSTILEIMKETPQIVVEISSHTDSKGDDAYNKKLSQERAQAVVDYLIKKGIDKKRLYAKGYGEERPIAPNENPDGTDNPDGREKNRRTEFKIIGSLDQYSEIIYED